VCSSDLEALKATAVLRENGVSIEHLHISTHKPFGDDSILDAIEKTKYGVISMENHTIIGGLGSSISELMAENGIAKRLIRIGLKDTYAHGGSKEYLMKYYGLNAMNLVKAVETLTGQKLNIKEEDLVEPQIDEIEQFIKSEDL